MYSGPLLKTGNLRDYMALGEIGQPVYAAADQIRTAVLHQIGRDAADLFAVPKFDAVGRNIDWYATLDGDIVPWDAASPEERETARQKLLDLDARIESHARRIVADPQSNDQMVFGRLLALCNHIPDTSHIFIIKGQPVLTFWGFVPAGADPARHKLADLVKPEPTAKPAAAPIAPMPAATAAGATLASVPIAAGGGFWPWLWWLLSLLLLLLILLIALRSCGVVDAPVPYVTDQGIVWPGEQPTTETVVTPGGDTVTGTIDGTTNGTVVVPDGTVDPNAPVAPDATLPGTTPEDQGATDKTEQPNADQTTPPEAPKPDDATPPDAPKPDEPTAGEQTPPEPNTPDAQQPDQKNGETPPSPDQQAGAQPPIKPIELPSDAGTANGPADFMQGQWRSQTGLRTTGSNAPATIGYQFDKQGKGTTTLKLGNGVTCSGASAATTQNGKLSIQDQGGLQCSDGTQFQGSTVECNKGADGKTHCVGRYPNGQQYDILLGQ
ncbi:SrfA family protein [Dongia sedimenti]|uniref:SrfA family protein n=1 Tax=Dongia sedimenti TaxID=3064282 RepID=A0ABU0YP53_9PROT|nr:SrfA family protein [Rhodospirillaceae bacterium R-7]